MFCKALLCALPSRQAAYIGRVTIHLDKPDLAYRGDAVTGLAAENRVSDSDSDSHTVPVCASVQACKYKGVMALQSLCPMEADPEHRLLITINQLILGLEKSI